MRCVDLQIEKCYDWNKLHNPYVNDANCDYMIYHGRLSKIDLNKGRKHKICPVCGKGFYRKGSSNKKYCSKECAEKANRGKNARIKGLGTPATTELNLSDAKSIHEEVERIRKGGRKPVYNGISKYELEIKNYVYNIK